MQSIEGSNYQFQICQEGIVTEPETPWQNKDPLQFFENYTEISEIKETNLGEEMKNVDEVWERMDKISPVSNHRTWETLGKFEPPKEPPFASESVEATLHLINIAEDSIFTNQSQLLCPIKEISSKEFIKHIKLLLLGVESSTFIYNKYVRNYILSLNNLLNRILKFFYFPLFRLDLNCKKILLYMVLVQEL